MSRCRRFLVGFLNDSGFEWHPEVVLAHGDISLRPIRPQQREQLPFHLLLFPVINNLQKQHFHPQLLLISQHLLEIIMQIKRQPIQDLPRVITYHDLPVLMQIMLATFDDFSEGLGLELVLFLEVVCAFEGGDELQVGVTEVVFLWVGEVVALAEAEVAVVENWLGGFWG